MDRRIATALLTCLALRWGAAVVTEIDPILPAYHYTDARQDHRQSAQVARAWRTGSEPMPVTASNRKLYVHWVALIYHAFGEHPVVPKLINGVFATGAAYLWYRLALAYVSPAAGLWFLWLLALWPSGIFFTSQNLKTAVISFFTALCFWLYTHLIGHSDLEQRPPGRVLRLAVLATLPLIVLGMLRSHQMAFAGAAIVFIGAWELFSRLRRGRPVLGPAAAILSIELALVAFQPTANFVITNVLFDDPPAFAQYRLETAHDMKLMPSTYNSGELVPSTYSHGEYVFPFSPRGLTQFRRLRYAEAQKWAANKMKRTIGTQVLPDAVFETWLDVARFLPKGFLYTTFMPLPGLYPLEGKIGRTLTAMEDSILLIFFLLAFAHLRRFKWSSSTARTLAAFFVVCALSYSLFEFDLGSATRHRIQYFPCFLPFAAAFLSDKLPRLRAALGGSSAHV